MPEPSFGREGEVKKNSGNAAAGNEERFEALGTNVGYIGYLLLWLHGDVVRGTLDFPGDEHCEEHACIEIRAGTYGAHRMLLLTEPHACADERQYPEEGIFEVHSL